MADKTKAAADLYDESLKKRKQLDSAYQDQKEIYESQLSDADTAYENLQREAAINKALQTRTSAQSDAAALIREKAGAQTISRRSTNNLSNSRGKISKQHKGFEDNVDLALKKLDIQNAAENAGLIAQNASEKSAAKLSQLRFDKNFGLKQQQQDLMRSESLFDHAYQLFTRRLINKNQFKAITGIEVKALPTVKKRSVIFTDPGLAAYLKSGGANPPTAADAAVYLQSNKAKYLKKYGEDQYNTALGYYQMKDTNDASGGVILSMPKLVKTVDDYQAGKLGEGKFYKDFAAAYTDTGKEYEEIKKIVENANYNISYDWLKENYPDIASKYQYTNSMEDIIRKSMGIVPASFDPSTIAQQIPGYNTQQGWDAQSITRLLDTAEKWNKVQQEYPGVSDDGLMTTEQEIAMGLIEPAGTPAVQRPQLVKPSNNTTGAGDLSYLIPDIQFMTKQETGGMTQQQNTTIFNTKTNAEIDAAIKANLGQLAQTSPDFNEMAALGAQEKGPDISQLPNPESYSFQQLIMGFINKPSSQRNKPVAPQNTFFPDSGYALRIYDYVEPDEADILRYYYAKGDMDSFNAYRKSIEKELEARMVTAEEDEKAKELDEAGPVGGRIASVFDALYSDFFAPRASVEDALNTIKGIITGQKVEIDPYSQWQRDARWENFYEDYATKGLSPALKGLAKLGFLGANIADKLPLFGMGAGAEANAAKAAEELANIRKAGEIEKIAGMAAKSDDELFLKYSNSIGTDEMPSLADFAKIRSENETAWKELTLKKGYKEAVNNGNISIFTRFEDYKNTAGNIDKNVIGMVTSNGIEIKGYANHFIDRVIGEYSETNYPLSGLRKGVPIDDIIDTLKNPIQKTDVIIDAEGLPSVIFYGKRCRVTINPETGDLIQTNPWKG